jgi:REP element-mobilizing transposase RayT
MRGSLVDIYLHLVWGTWNRFSCITPDIEETVHSAIAAKCAAHRCPVLAIRGTLDHVHVLVRAAPVLDVPALVRDAKGSSSHLITASVEPSAFFRWQGRYGALGIDPRGVDRVCDYIRNQKKHHAERTESAYLEYYLTAPDPEPE